MRKEGRFKNILKAINNFLVFFMLIAFVITCCIMLFISVMTSDMGIALTEESISAAAKLTFINAIFLSLLFTVFDFFRRRLGVDRPVKKITQAAERMMQGDFSVRIPKLKTFNAEDGFNDIADCFNKVAKELSGSETLRTDFIANVSHEIKTPLSVIQNYGSLLQQPSLSEEERMEYAKAITSASRRLASLVTNILRLNKLENQQIAPKAEVYDLSEQLCECLLGFEDAWEQKQLNIDTDIEDGITVCSDEEMLGLVWNNLFSNAVKFTPEGGSLSLSAHTEGGYAVVRVQDSGCGISKEVGERMFDKFYQGDPSHATAGNGLGLALVKRVIDLTGCSISVESEVGKGSAFTVKVRRAADEGPR